MKEVRILKEALKPFFKMNAARLHCLAAIILTLLKVRSVNFSELADGLPGNTKKASKYKRIQRFFSLFQLPWEAVALFVAQTVRDFPWVLTLDRTNWKFGNTNINILVLAIAYKGAAFPILWIPLPKRGNSNTSDRIKLMERFLAIFGASSIRCITGDREFIGQSWFAYLIEKIGNFRMRIKENTLVTNSRGIPVSAKSLFRNLNPGQWVVLEGKRMVMGHELYVAGLKQPNGEYVILVTPIDPEAAMDDYKQRWEIETLFGCLKTRGFRFESTHLRDPDRISNLFGVLAIGFAWCHVIGEWADEREPIKIKKHGRMAISLFRYGLDTIRGILLNLVGNLDRFRSMIKILLKRFRSSVLLPARGTLNL